MLVRGAILFAACFVLTQVDLCTFASKQCRERTLLVTIMACCQVLSQGAAALQWACRYT